MSEITYKVFGYRWVVLGVFMLVNCAIQILWITYAPINTDAAAFYHVSKDDIDLLGNLFLIAFLPFSIPISWVLDKFGSKLGIGIGSVLMAIFAVVRAIAGSDYTLVLIGSIGLAIAQPFFLNSWTKVAAQWFPRKERATAVGIVTLSNLIGAAIGQALTPLLVPSIGMVGTQWLWAGIAIFSAAMYLVLAREKPATPPDESGGEERALMLDGLKHALSMKSFWLYLASAFLAMGVFIGIQLLVNDIITPHGFDAATAGTVAAVIILGGIVGAVILPALSDKSGRRLPFLILGLVGGIPGVIGLACASSLWLLLVSAFVLGFFVISTLPLGLQFAAEFTHPTPEGTSNGLIQLFGQASFVLVLIMQSLVNAHQTVLMMWMCVGFLAVATLLVIPLKNLEKKAAAQRSMKA